MKNPLSPTEEAMHDGLEPGSFRDPSGFLFFNSGTRYRQVDPIYATRYDRLMQSGLYDELVAARLLVSHEERDLALSPLGGAYRVIEL